jgi:diadenosine tetraphosphate (Ap4A) HIT family hydrolase
MIPNESLEIFRTPHWLIRHSAEAAIPGYVVLYSTHALASSRELPKAASEELGPLLQCTVKAVGDVVKPERVYVCLFNETGSAVHFHVFPRMSWMRKFSPGADDPGNLIDGGVVFSAARRAKSDPAAIREAEPQILEAAAAIRKLVTEAKLFHSRSRL